MFGKRRFKTLMDGFYQGRKAGIEGLGRPGGTLLLSENIPEMLGYLLGALLYSHAALNKRIEALEAANDQTDPT